MNTYETIRYDGPDADGIARITLHRPERLERVHEPHAARALRRVRRGRRRPARARGRRDRFGPGVLRGRRSQRRRADVLGRQANRSRPRRRRRTAHLRLHEARHRRGERPGGGSRRVDDARDGCAARVPVRHVRVRVHPARHRARSVLVVVPAAPRGRPDRARLDDVGSYGRGDRRDGGGSRACGRR